MLFDEGQLFTRGPAALRFEMASSHHLDFSHFLTCFLKPSQVLVRSWEENERDSELSHMKTSTMQRIFVTV